MSGTDLTATSVLICAYDDTRDLAGVSWLICGGMRVMSGFAALLMVLGSAATLAACGTAPRQESAASALRAQGQSWPSGGALDPASPASDTASPARPAHSAAPSGHPAPASLPVPGNPSGGAAVPAAAQPVNTSHPTHVIGNGTPASCTSAAVVTAVAEGGIITFDCGPDPVTITMTATAKVSNTSHQVVLDGGGKVTLSGGGKIRILYMNTCDANQTLTTNDCWEQQWPQLVVQNIGFTDAYSATQQSSTASYGGGAIFDQGGQLKVVNSVFTGN